VVTTEESESDIDLFIHSQAEKTGKHMTPALDLLYYTNTLIALNTWKALKLTQ
jgi:hypothetical protein